MWWTLVLARLLAVVGGLCQPPAPPVPALGPVDVVLAPALVRSECFLLAPAAGPDPAPVAVARVVRLDTGTHTLLEREVVFAAEGWWVHHTEALAGTTRRLTWREGGPGGARAWLVDWDLASANGGAEAGVVGHGWQRATHEALRGEAPWIGPLEWAEAARADALGALGAVAWLTPPRAQDGRARRAAAPVTTAAEVRTLEAGPEGRLTFAGTTLVSFTLGGPHGLVATPTTEAEFQRLAGRWRHRPTGHHPLVAAALRRDGALRELATRIEAGAPARW